MLTQIPSLPFGNAICYSGYRKGQSPITQTYPVWEYISIDEALAYTEQNYNSVAQHYPDKPVIITEAGWTTRSNGQGIEPTINIHIQRTAGEKYRNQF